MLLLPLRCLRVFISLPQSTLTRGPSEYCCAYLFTRPTVVKVDRRDRVTHYLIATMPGSEYAVPSR